MARPTRCLPLLVGALLLAACGSGDEIDPDTYTCAQFRTSLDGKDDISAGQFIRLLNERAQIGGERDEQERIMAYSIFIACRGERGTFRPAREAVANARKIRRGERVRPEPEARPRDRRGREEDRRERPKQDRGETSERSAPDSGE